MSQIKREPQPVESVHHFQGETSHAGTADAVLPIIGQMLRGLQFGQIQVIVRDGVVVQLERTERRRVRGPK